MVRITIYIEGSTTLPHDSAEVQIVDNSAFFRESFSKLFAKKINPAAIDLVIQPIGPITQAEKYLQKIEKDKIDGVLLIDLDAPKSEISNRKKSYEPLDTSKIFFMIQEMEAWIISQISCLELYAKQEGYIRKREGEDISDNSLIKNRNPEEISKPSAVLDTLFRQYFDTQSSKGGVVRYKGKRYSKAKDSPNLISLLDMNSLISSFTDVAALVVYIESKY
jgi:hypothetical protein